MSKRTKFLLGIGVIATLVLGWQIAAFAGPVGNAQGFEDDDGNLVDNATAGIDWNTFAPTTWTGTAPTRTATDSANGFTFAGQEDWVNTGADSAFAGGTKQDNNCANTVDAKAPNKDDLKRIYLASKVVDGDVYLDLAWIRFTQNTTSPSAHIGFEFNQSKVACGGTAGADGLVQRTAGDMLIVYDFEGGSTDVPTLTLRRWVTSGSCEVGSNSPPCWGPATNLTAGGFAEGRVNTTATALDEVADPDETLGLNEFGEAGINLTDAGVFSANTCANFGKAYAVSRSSGNSATAQMKDLVKPVNFDLKNCGEVTIIKHTNPGGLDQNFGFESNLAGGQLACTTDTTPASFTLNDAGTDTETCTNVPIGNYTVTEGTDPAGFSLESLTCTATGSGSGSQNATTPKQADITIAAGGDTVTCTYVNKQQQGAIQVTKQSSKTGHLLSGAHFSVTGPGGFSTTLITGDTGTACVDGLDFGTYTVTETAAPGGFVIDDPSGQSVTVDNNAACDDSPYGGEMKTFTDTPTATIQVNFKDDGSGETSLVSAITCDNATGDPETDNPIATGWDSTLDVTGIEAPATIHCTIDIDP